MNDKINSKTQFAAIYIRTSSEIQGAKSSPNEQEKDCIAYAEQQGLSVVAVYRDIQKYRVNGRMVEPSGTRTDRPGLYEMLKHGEVGNFHTIIAWREDRLYRGLKAMLFILDWIQENNLNILLARENFDSKMAPIKAWLASMELDSMRERMSMGVKARLRAGKANTGQDRYGYQRNGDSIEIQQDEAKWVRKIFAWFIQRVPIMEIRRRLIEAGAPQKGSSVPRKIHWAKSSIQSILKAAHVYTFGIKVYTRDGEKFNIPIPSIIDQETYRTFLKVRQSNKTYPARNLKRDYLIGGLLYCECDRKWGSRTNTRITRKNRRGEIVPRKTKFSGTYFCPEKYPERIHQNCPRTIGQIKADNYVWEKIIDILCNPEAMLIGAREYINEFRSNAESLNKEKEQLDNELDSIRNERQWIITQGRKRRISEEDMEIQLAEISLQEVRIRQDIAKLAGEREIGALDNWEDKTKEYLSQLKSGLELLNTNPTNDAADHEQFLAKKQIVQLLVEKVLIGEDREISIIFKIDLLSLINQSEILNEVQLGGTYTRTPASRVRLWLSGVYA